MSKEKNKTKNTWSKLWKWLLIPFLLLLLLSSVRWLLKSELLLGYLKETAEREVSSRINGHLSIGSFEGDLLHGVQLADIRITDDQGELLLSTDSLFVHYSALNLIRQPYEVKLLSVGGMNLYAEQDVEGVWNFEKLIPPDPEAGTADEEPVEPPLWNVDQIMFQRSSVSAISPDLPDGRLVVNKLGFLGSAGYNTEGWKAAVDDFQFYLEEGRLSQPVEVGAAARLDGEKITLEKLLVNTGRTFLESRAVADGTEHLDGQINLAPFSWLDLRAYSELPLEEDISGNIGFEGSLDELRIQVNFTANGMETLMMDGTFHLRDEPYLSRFSARIRNFDGPSVTGDTLAPVLRSAELDGAGHLLFNSPDQSRFAGQFNVSGVHFDQYALDDLVLGFDWIESSADLALVLNHTGQTAEGNASVRNIFDDFPDWQVSLNGNHINLASWLNEPDYDSDLNFNIRAEGRGLELTEEVFAVEAALLDSRWDDQRLDRLDFNGTLSSVDFAGLLEVEAGDGRIDTDFAAQNWQTDPVYRFTATVQEFNLADLNGFEEFPTYLNATLTGEGAWFDLENLELTTTVQFDSSIVNNEPLESFHAYLEIRNQVATIENAELQSAVADAVFSIRQHLLDFRDPGNTLSIEAQIKDIHSLAPLMDVETIEATGFFGGRLYRQEQGELQFDSNITLSEIVYDTLFTVEAVEGRIGALLFEEPEIELDLDILTPAVDSFALQSINFSTRTTLGDTLVAGTLAFTFVQDEENAVRHAGTYEYLGNDFLLRTSELSFSTPLRTLDLQSPFDLVWKDEVLTMEPLQIQSPGGSAWLKLVIPYLDENRQEISMDANLLDLGTLQRSFLDETYAEALVSGQLDFRREYEEIRANTALLFQDISYRNGDLDSLKIDMTIDDKRLKALAGVWHEENELLYINGDVPFEPGDPLTFDDEFFDQPVEGVIRMPPMSLAFWKQFFEDEFESEGKLSFDSRIGGTAGDPLFNGALSMSEGNLSGVAVDTMSVNIDYSHESSEIRFDGSIYSLGTQIVDFEALLPLYIDLRAFQIEPPGDEDEVSVSFFTENFNLTMLSYFLDRDIMRDLRGNLNGNIELSGTIGSLEPRGDLRVSNGNVRVVPAGITISEITSSVNLTPDLVQLESFSMRSGPGRFTASGSVDLVDLSPGNLNINLQANQFRVSNTSEVNAIVDLNSRLRGTVESPELTGTLRFRSGFVNLQNFGEQAMEDVRLEDDPEPTEIAFYESMSVEMGVEFDRQFFIRNRQYLDMEIELGGVIDMVKQPGSDLEMFGTIEGISGYARPFGRNFELEEAVVAFSGPINNPELNIRTLHRPPQTEDEITIWYIIDGTVEDPSFRFESEPFLELQDIISYTLFGRPFYALDSWQQAVSGGGSGTTAADVALDLLLDRVEMLAAQQLGIDVVQIDTNRTASGSSTTIKTGWYLSNRTFFAVLNEISGTSPKTLFLLEYLIRRNLQLVVTQGDDSREGIDLRWNYDY